MTITLPKRENILATTAADPLKFYYIPVARSFYLGRFADALRLLGKPVDNLLDFGCGSGIFLPELARWCRHLYATDVHESFDRVARMLEAEGVSAELKRSEGSGLPYADNSMDAITAMSVLEHIRDLGPYADEFYRVLKPGGVAVVGVPVSNIMTEIMLRLSYLTLTAKLEDEHVSTHRDVVAAFEKRFNVEAKLHIPRLLPEFLRMYTTVLFRKPA